MEAFVSSIFREKSSPHNGMGIVMRRITMLREQFGKIMQP